MKQIFLLVLGAHLILVAIFGLFKPVKKEEKRPLKVTTIVAAPPAPTQKKRAPQKTSSPPTIKKTTKVAKKSSPAKKAPTKKVVTQPKIPLNLLRDLEESIAKIDEKGDKDRPKAVLETPKLIPQLKVEGGSQGAESFIASLVGSLQKRLELPEKGEVKIELTLTSSGTLQRLSVIESQSLRNDQYLSKRLRSHTFPPFNGTLKKEKEHTFVITFCSH